MDMMKKSQNDNVKKAEYDIQKKEKEEKIDDKGGSLYVTASEAQTCNREVSL